LYRHADQVVVNSPGFIAHVQSRGASRVTLVPNGSDTAMFDSRADGTSFRQAHGLVDKFIALYAGAHGLSNDLGVVLDSAALLADRPEIAFVLMGAGKEKPALVSKAQAMGLGNVHFLEPLPKTEMPEALGAADACIAILKPIEMYRTVYPNKVFDYMAAGRPVVLAIDGVIREVVEQVGAGIAVPPGDASALAEAIRSLAADPQKGRQMGLAGRRCVEESFDRALLAGKLAVIMEALVQKGTN
jgi:glycosyltransferase involved in cell wall biosynthesis